MNRRSTLGFSPGAAGPLLAREDEAGLPASFPVWAIDGIAAGPDDTADRAWQDRALCAQTDPEAFFPGKGGSTREAKRVCRSCEVRAECLEYALDNDERFGIWGGMSERERRRIKRHAA